MEETNVTQEVLDKVKEAAGDGHLACPKARQLAKDLGVPASVVGEACNQLKIKIKDCALGCF